MFPANIMANIVAICLGACGIVLFTHLLRTGSIGAIAYPTLVIGTLLIAIAIARIDVLEILDVKNLRVTLRDIRQVRAEVYAKAEEVQKLAAGIASFTAASVVAESRFTGLDHQERMLRRRDELSAFLKDAGVPDDRREELIRPITMMVDWDLRRAIVVNAVASWQVPPGINTTDTSQRDALQAEIEAILQQPDRVKALQDTEKLLQDRGVSSEILSQSIDEYRRMLTSGRLPETGLADDLKRAPLR